MKMGTSRDTYVKLVDQFSAFLLKTSPVTATYVGIHEFDEDLADLSEEALKARQQKLAEFKKSFKALGKFDATRDDLIDLNLILGRIELEQILYKKYPVHKLLPDLYLNEILFGVYALITRDFAPIRDRALSATRRLVQAPNVLRHARKNLVNPPEIFVESALHTATGAVHFLNTAIPEFATGIRGALREALLEASEEAVEELEKFSLHLKETLLPKAKNEFAIGKDLYNDLLRVQHHLPHTTDALLRLARKAMKETEDELNKVADSIQRGKGWQKVLENQKKDHPAAKGLVSAYEKEMARARKFVATGNIATIPEKDNIEVVPTPPFARGLIATAAYIPPAPLDADSKGFFWVSVPNDAQREEAIARLKGHSKWFLPIVAVHEAYPGHHLQQLRVREHKRLVRYLIETPTFSEGWALYCEEMMDREGYTDDPRERLFRLSGKLLRACRVLVDVGLHSKTMKINQAVKTLVETAGLEQASAEAEVRWACQNPTQPMSNLIGMLEIQTLLADVKKKRGSEFSLKAFHDELLSHGTLPVSMLRPLLGV